MTIDVKVLRDRLRQFADQAAGLAAGLSRALAEQGDIAEAQFQGLVSELQFQAGRQAAFVTALSQITLAEQEAVFAYEAEIAADLEDELIGEEAARLGLIGGGAAVDLDAVERLEEYAARGLSDMRRGLSDMRRDLGRVPTAEEWREERR